jgi:hypothetical protein
MMQPLPVTPAATQLELIGQPLKPPSTTLSEEMVPMEVQHQCVELLANMLASVVAATSEGDHDER